MIALTWLACTSGSITTTELPDARVGERYSVAIEANKRAAWTFEAEGLPAGLTINPSTGTVSGVPAQGGDATVTIRIEAEEGDVREEREFALAVERAEGICGTQRSGTFAQAAIDGSELVWDIADGWTAVTLPVPRDGVEEVVFEFTSNGSYWFLMDAGVAPSADESIWSRASFLGVFDGTERLGWGDTPHLGTYQAVGEDLTLVVASALGEDEWALDVSCATSPVLLAPALGPFRVGDRAVGSIRATKYDEEIVVEALDPMPAGLELSERGSVTGVPTEPGLHTFRTRLTRETTGSESVVDVAIGVFEPIVAECGQTVAIPPLGLGDHDYDWEFDPGSFVVVEAPWEDHVGMRYDVALEATSWSTYMQVLHPVTPSYDWFFGDEKATTIEATPQSWPPASFYQRGRALALQVGSVQGEGGEVTLTCDDGPRPVETTPTVLPVGSVDVALQATGGTAPYLWSATGLPDGLTLDPDGMLTGTADDFGSAIVDVGIEDAGGAVTTTPLTFWSMDTACDVTVACGAVSEVVARLDTPPTVCVSPEEVLASDWVIYEVSHNGFGVPSLLPPGEFDVDRVAASYRGYQGPLISQRGTQEELFSLERYDNRPWPLLLDLLNDEETFEVCVACGTGPVPVPTEACP